MNRTGLVVVFNHNFERNLPIIRRLYADRFGQMIQLMPFYGGQDSDVLRVFGNSFRFQAYIAQARTRLQRMDCDRFLFVSDDLLLNPTINETNMETAFRLGENDVFVSKFYDVSNGIAHRGTREAHNFTMQPPGLDATALREIPTHQKAFDRLHTLGVLETEALRKCTPWMTQWRRPLLANWHYNYKALRGRAWHLREAAKYWFGRRRVSYPVVFAYSDIFSIPARQLDRFCKMIEVFATVNMFVELAIPTALAFLETPLVFEDDLELRPLNLWFPPDPKQFEKKKLFIQQFENAVQCRTDGIAKHFPADILYIHPIKLSKWN